MRARRVTAPAVEPLTITTAKEHLRVDFADDDTFITWSIRAARRAAEVFTRRFFITQTWDFLFDDFPSYSRNGTDVISILRGGSQSVTHVKYYDSDGTQQTLVDGTNYRSYENAQDDNLRIGLIQGQSWPGIESKRLNAVEVRAVMGYGDASTDVPSDIRWAIRLMIADIYEHREQTVIGQTVNTIPNAAQNILLPYQLPVWGAQG